MNGNIFKRNELLAQKVIKGLNSRNMTGYYAENREAALKLALSLIPEGSSVSMGGTMSAQEIGLVLFDFGQQFIERQRRIAGARRQRAYPDRVRRIGDQSRPGRRDTHWMPSMAVLKSCHSRSACPDRYRLPSRASKAVA